MRTYRQQFEGQKLEQIEELINGFQNLNYPTGPARYYGLDLAMCLQSGALAGSMVIASALLELYVRGLIVCYSEKAQEGWSKQIRVESELEEMRNKSFNNLLDHLVEVNLFNGEDAEQSKVIYKNIRIPVHHGLPSRLLKKDQNNPFADLIDLLNSTKSITQNQFEDFIEVEAITIVNDIYRILKNNQVKLI